MKKISLFGRELTTKTIAALAVISVVAAAMVTTYATITGDVTLQTPISASPSSWTATTHYAGDSITRDFTITNSATERDVSVKLVGTITDGSNNIENGEIEKVQLKAVTDGTDYQDCTLTISGGVANFDCGSNDITHSTSEDFTLKVVFAPNADATTYTITLNINA